MPSGKRSHKLQSGDSGAAPSTTSAKAGKANDVYPPYPVPPGYKPPVPRSTAGSLPGRIQQLLDEREGDWKPGMTLAQSNAQIRFKLTTGVGMVKHLEGPSVPLFAPKGERKKGKLKLPQDVLDDIVALPAGTVLSWLFVGDLVVEDVTLRVFKDGAAWKTLCQRDFPDTSERYRSPRESFNTLVSLLATYPVLSKEQFFGNYKDDDDNHDYKKYGNRDDGKDERKREREN